MDTYEAQMLMDSCFCKNCPTIGKINNEFYVRCTSCNIHITCNSLGLLAIKWNKEIRKLKKINEQK